MTTDPTTTPTPAPARRPSWGVRAWRRGYGPAAGGGVRGRVRRVFAMTVAGAPLALVAGWELASLQAGNGWTIPGVL
ncbi:hypothetical protein [Cellulomonas soli]|uniref:Uncharacterized protein n=1 Tax=Cellulomonas soli TaxID=931535 RepID=A0A512PDS2_9CELL|nr:hypothetical protein [Cellulomonas soli]NYI59147.1 hypothetical protein [Cellulomonas soli]GEP69360.1 hypothetical protein CSO01_20750 [Cellulomonas soli]